MFIQYEDVLLGKRQSFQLVRREELEEKGIPNAIKMLRYVFDDLLGWTPEMVRDYLTLDLIKWLKVERAFNKIPFPPELDPKKDLFYVASVLYPDVITYRKKDFTLQVYEKVISGELKKYPKKFFNDDEGFKNIIICLRYCIAQELFSYTTEQVYELFSNPKKAAKFLTNARLKKYVDYYYSDYLDLLHETLTEEYRNSLFYNYYKFQREKNLTIEKIKEKKENED